MIRLGLVVSLIASGCSAGFPEDGSDPPDTESSTCSAPELTDKPLLRLSNTELENTLHALLGSDLAADLVLPVRTTADDGFDADHRALQVGELVVEQLHDLALEISLRVAERPGLVLRCDMEHDDDRACTEGLIDDFLPRAFRRPLAPIQRERYLALGEALLSEEGLAVTIGVLVQAALQSPEFLYRLQHVSGDEGVYGSEGFDGYTIASRISYLVWQAPPDDLLMADAATGALVEPEVRAAHIERMFADPRAAGPARDFARQWLGLGRLDVATKDAERFPEFDAQLARMMREQTERFVARTLLDKGGSFEALLTSTQVHSTQQLADLYGISHAGEEPWESASLPPAERAGVLTQAAWLSIGAHQQDGSPVLRGVDVLRRILCIEPGARPDGIVDVPRRPDANEAQQTNRERFESRVDLPQCLACHQAFDPIGYTFESFDAIGRYRTHDGIAPVNTQATLYLPGELGGVVGDSIELSHQMASSRRYALCMSEKLNRFAQAREQGSADRCRVEHDRERMAAAGNTYLAWLLGAVQRPGFVRRPREENGP